MSAKLKEFPSPPVTVFVESEVKALMRQMRLDQGAMVLLDASGKVLLIESSTQRGSIGNLIYVLQDSIAGVDVPQRIRNDYDQLWKSYRATLESVRVTR
jgi:hypothetical protein